LEGIPEKWLVSQEMCRGTTKWKTLQQKIIVTFSFEHENPNMDLTLNKIRGVILIDEPKVEIMTDYQQQNKHIFKELLSCYHVEEEAPYEDNPHNIKIIEIEGEKEVEGPYVEL
jgi:hypothetical protein